MQMNFSEQNSSAGKRQYFWQNEIPTNLCESIANFQVQVIGTAQDSTRILLEGMREFEEKKRIVITE